jgi:anti-sigma factor RsiW
MKPIDDNPAASHDAVLMMLPWYVNKTLQDAELNAVKRHLTVCAECNRELLSLQRLSVAVKQAVAFNTDSQASFSHLKARIQANAGQPQPQPTATVIRPNQWRNAIKKLTAIKIPQPALALAAAVLLAVLLPRVFSVNPILHEGYQTLSNSKTTESNPNEISLIFKDNTPQQAIEQIVASAGGHIVKGPNAQSVYTIGFNKDIESSQVIGKLSLLKSNAAIIFAEPAYGLLSKAQAKGEKP